MTFNSLIRVNSLCGGSWDDYPRYCRSAYRSRYRPDFALYDVGFRVVCKPPKTSKMIDFKRLLRGGSWLSFPWNCRSARRIHDQPGRAYYYVGFRVVCKLPKTLNKTLKMINYKLLRGGSWFNNPRYCRSARRDRARPGIASSGVGFRVVCLPQIAQPLNQMLQGQVNQLDGFVTELTIFRKNATDRVFSLSWNPGLDTVVVTDGSQAICVSKEQINSIANGVVMLLDQGKVNE